MNLKGAYMFYKKIFLKFDDVIVMPWNVHKWKGKPRSILLYDSFFIRSPHKHPK